MRRGVMTRNCHLNCSSMTLTGVINSCNSPFIHTSNTVQNMRYKFIAADTQECLLFWFEKNGKCFLNFQLVTTNPVETMEICICVTSITWLELMMKISHWLEVMATSFGIDCPAVVHVVQEMRRVWSLIFSAFFYPTQSTFHDKGCLLFFPHLDEKFHYEIGLVRLEIVVCFII